MKVLHPTDFSECSEQARSHAITLARSLDAEIILLHVSDEAPLYGEGLMGMQELRGVYDAQRKWAEETLEARAAEMRDLGVDTRWERVTGTPSKEIVAIAEKETADFIVMGTHGRTGIDRLLLGSVASKVVRTAKCPVLTVREKQEA